jgi:two-component system sensor histidine kinase RegB
MPHNNFDANIRNNTRHTAARRNLKRLIALRDISIAVQAFLVALAIIWLDLPLPLLPLGSILALLGAWNLYTWWQWRQDQSLQESDFFLQLLVDILAFTGVLYFAGGATNPFAWFYLLPLMIGATLLSSRLVWVLAGIMIAAYTVLMAYYVPLSPMSMEHHDFSQHVYGMWFGFVLSAVLATYFVTTIAATLRERDQALSAAREQALRDERLVSLGTLAAGAAHELGTPLGTMAIVVDELDRQAERKADTITQDSLMILREQITRCKDALSVIASSAGEIRAEEGQAMPVDRFIKQCIEQWQQERPNIHLETHLDDKAAPQLVADRSLQQALINILNNAADASPQFVSLTARWSMKYLTIEVTDKGPGLSHGQSHSAGKEPFSTKEHGMGLGLFLAHAVIERMGGEVTLSNLDEGGVCTHIRLPLSLAPFTPH